MKPSECIKLIAKISKPFILLFNFMVLQASFVHFPGSVMILAPYEELRLWSDPEVLVQPLEWI